MFAKDLRKNIKLSDDSINTYLNFGFCMKAVNYSYSSFRVIGFCRVKIEEIFRNNYSFFKKCPVLNENDVRVGSVTLKIEITDQFFDGKYLKPYKSLIMNLYGFHDEFIEPYKCFENLN